MRALILPHIAAASLVLALSPSAPAAQIRPSLRPVPAATEASPAAEAEAPAIQFTRALPRPPVRYEAVVAPAAMDERTQDGSPHPRPRAFRGACNSTTGC